MSAMSGGSRHVVMDTVEVRRTSSPGKRLSPRKINGVWVIERGGPTEEESGEKTKFPSHHHHINASHNEDGGCRGRN